MAEYYMQSFDDKEISLWDFEALKSGISRFLAGYENTVYTDERSARGAKSEINTIKRKLESRRKEYKRQCLAPYEAVEPQIKELVHMLDGQIVKIDNAVKAFELNRKAEKEKTVMALFFKRAECLGDYAVPLYKKLFNPKWLNASCQFVNIEQEIVMLVETAEREIEQIKSLGSPYTKHLLDEYAERLTLDEVLAHNNRLMEANKAAGILPTSRVNLPQESAEVHSAEAADAEREVRLLLRVTDGQLEKIKAFLNDVGAKYSIE